MIEREKTWPLSFNVRKRKLRTSAQVGKPGEEYMSPTSGERGKGRAEDSFFLIWKRRHREACAVLLGEGLKTEKREKREN